MLISFDLDGVLMRNPFRDGVFPAVGAAMAAVFGGDARRAIEAVIEEHFRRLSESRQDGGQAEERAARRAIDPYDWDSIIETVAKSRGLEGMPPQSVATMVEYYAGRPGFVACTHPTVRATLSALRRDGHRLVVVTNGLSVYQRPVLEALGLLGFFETLAAPDLCGHAKPDAGAFYAGTGELRAPEAVHVGDDLLYDVAGAKKAGLLAVWVMPPRLSRGLQLASTPPWERPAALQRLDAWHAEVARSLDRRPAADRALVDWARPDAAVVHVGELPALIAHWQRGAASTDSAASSTSGAAGATLTRARRGARKSYRIPAVPLGYVGEALVRWFEAKKRDLPWRRSGNPYAVLVSEFMLQQTQVSTVIPYFERFMERFPTLEILAQAAVDDVLQVWQGLGYYRRARYLHEAARTVVARYGGRIPDDPAELRRLPGVGPYMAGAIASIAYNRPEVAVDGNAARVLSRLVLHWEPPGARSARELSGWARGMVPEGRAADFTQALMELGSQICRPREPLCRECPVQRLCAAWAYRLQAELPVRRASPPVPLVRVAAAVVTDARGRVLLVRRPEDRLLGSLWALPAEPLADDEPWEAAARRAALHQAGIQAEVVQALGETQHTFSHQRWRLRAFRMRALPPKTLDGARSVHQSAAAEAPSAYGTLEVRWASPAEIPSLPMARAFQRLLQLDGTIEVRRAAP